jgi:glycosyltransferase involved in cell wall biosynthesis
MRTAVLIPTYQEADNITTVLQRVRAVVPAATIVVLDDNSPDGTADLAEAIGREIGGVQVLRRPGKQGLGRAYLAGYAWALDAGYDVVVDMDADGSHDPATVPELLASIDGGADLAMGSRYVPGGTMPAWPWHRRLLSQWGNRYTSAVLGIPLRDATGGFRAYRTAMLRRVDLDSVRANGYGFQIEMAYRVLRNGGTVVELPIEFRDRTLGTSKMSGAIVAEALLLVTWWAVRDRILRRRASRWVRQRR